MHFPHVHGVLVKLEIALHCSVQIFFKALFEGLLSLWFANWDHTF